MELSEFILQLEDLMRDKGGDIMIGPKHYEGWTCEECEHLTPINEHYFCSAPRKNSRSSMINWRIKDMTNTPSHCPYPKEAIMLKCVEGS